ncbi:MAG: outer membrane beta-barrel protein [Betaproteobacteria bacterium]
MLRNKILAAAVVSAFASPMVSAADEAKPAGPAIPTLSQILESSGITMNGYIDATYSHANKEPIDRAFDNKKNSFLLNQVGLTIAKQPKEGFGGLVNVVAGQDAKIINAADGNGDSTFNLTQAFIQYATGDFVIMGGKMLTLQGTEVINPTQDVNISRSLLFFGEPVTHTGVRGTYTVNEMVSLTAGLNNGISSSASDNNTMKTIELGATFTPIKPLVISVSDLNGKEGPTGTEDTRNSFNAIVSYTPIDPLTLGAEYLRVSQKVPGAETQKYSGIAGYASYMFMPKLRGTVRAEWVKDNDGIFLNQGVTDNKIKELTLTLSYLATDSFELRGEVRGDRSDKEVFTDSSGGSLSKSLTTFAVEGIYKF